MWMPDCTKAISSCIFKINSPWIQNFDCLRSAVAKWIIPKNIQWHLEQMEKRRLGSRGEGGQGANMTGDICGKNESGYYFNCWTWTVNKLRIFSSNAISRGNIKYIKADTK